MIMKEITMTNTEMSRDGKQCLKGRSNPALSYFIADQSKRLSSFSLARLWMSQSFSI